MSTSPTGRTTDPIAETLRFIERYGTGPITIADAVRMAHRLPEDEQRILDDFRAAYPGLASFAEVDYAKLEERALAHMAGQSAAPRED